MQFQDLKLLIDKTQWDIFNIYIKKELPVNIRVNTLKTDKETLKKRLEKKSIKVSDNPHCKDCLILKDIYEQNLEKVGKLMEYFLGLFYVQDTVSAIPAYLLEPTEKDIVLDLCAAPGSKTTQIAQLMKNKGTIIANEVNTSRIKALVENIERLGITNTIVVNYNALNFPKKLKFDKILLDAPCSGLGNIRKDAKVFDRWNKKTYEKLESIQYRMLEQAYQLLKDKGILIYSTCTFNPLENEFIIDKFIKKYEDIKLIDIQLDIPHSRGLTEYKEYKFSKELKKTIRFYPHHLNSGGFYIAKLSKL